MKKRKKRNEVWMPSESEKGEIDRLARLVFDYMRHRMAVDWHLVKSQHRDWSEEKCERYLRAAKGHIIRSMRSGI